MEGGKKNKSSVTSEVGSDPRDYVEPIVWRNAWTDLSDRHLADDKEDSFNMKSPQLHSSPSRDNWTSYQRFPKKPLATTRWRNDDKKRMPLEDDDEARQNYRHGRSTKASLGSDYRPSLVTHPLILSPYRVNLQNKPTERREFNDSVSQLNRFQPQQHVSNYGNFQDAENDTASNFENIPQLKQTLQMPSRTSHNPGFLMASERPLLQLHHSLTGDPLKNMDQREIPPRRETPLHIMTDFSGIELPQGGNNLTFNPIYPFSNQEKSPIFTDKSAIQQSNEQGVGEKSVTFSTADSIIPDTKKTDQHLESLFSEIFTIRSEAESVQYKYRREREAWTYQNAALQAKVIDLSNRLKEKSEMLADVHSQYSNEVITLKNENQELMATIRDESVQSSAKMNSDKHEAQMDDLIVELYSLKRDLEMLRNRYEDEKKVWEEKNNKLENRIKDMDHRRTGDDEDMAQATLHYRFNERNVKKEKDILEMELEDEKRRTRALEIEVDVLRDQVMKVQTKRAGLLDKEDEKSDLMNGDRMEVSPEDLVDYTSTEQKQAPAILSTQDNSQAPPAHSTPTISVQTHSKQVSPEAAEKILKLEERMHEKNVELTNKREEIEKLNEEKEKAQKELAEYKERKDTIQNKLQQAREEAKERNEAKEELQNENDRLKEENIKKKDECRRMREELERTAEAEKERDKLANENKELKDRLEKDKLDLEKELEKERAERRRLEDRLRNIKNRMDDGRRNYKNFQGDIEELTKLVD